MAKMHWHDLAEVIGKLPEISPFSPASLAGLQDALFLCALGFEQRCLAIPRGLAAAGYKSSRAVYLQYSTNQDDNAVNLPGLQAALTAIGGRAEPMQVDTADLCSRLEEMIESLPRPVAGSPPVVVFDISVVANRALVRCLKTLLESDVSLKVVYAEAASYRPTKAEYEAAPDRWQSDDHLGLERGVLNVAPSPDQPGVRFDPLPDCIILFPSFKAERSWTVITRVDPSLVPVPGDKVIWLLGRPHSGADHWRIEAMRRINHIPSDGPQHEVSTFDYKDCLKTLELIYAKLWDRHNVSLCPLGSKLQALGTSLFLYVHPDVRVMCAVPKEYNAVQYSEGCKSTWVIDFGALTQIRQLLGKVGQVSVET